MIKKIALLDTSITTENIGDKIIMDYARKVMCGLFKDSFYVCLPTHDVISKPAYYHMQSSDYRFICGTNLLSSNMNKYNQWKINMWDSLFINDITLFGVGWWQYQNKPNIYTSILYNRVLSKNKLHSVRDSFTERQLRSIGINNVINTSCPTMWGLTPDHCEQIPHSKGKNALMTLTDYNKDPERDTFLIKTLLKNYNKIFFWIQAWNDLPYIESLGFSEDVINVAPTLQAFDSIFEQEESLDYIGTRLHAGIRALNCKARSIIIGIDNRAIEKSKDFNLPVISRSDLEKKLGKKINSKFKSKITIPLDEIEKWKSQFD